MNNNQQNICPFCKKENNCQHQKPESCWCMTTKIPENLLKLLPNQSVRKACICKECITSYLENREAFIKKYCSN